MRKIHDGLVYDTDTAELIIKKGPFNIFALNGDAIVVIELVYKTPGGRYFIITQYPEEPNFLSRLFPGAPRWFTGDWPRSDKFMSVKKEDELGCFFEMGIEKELGFIAPSA